MNLFTLTGEILLRGTDEAISDVKLLQSNVQTNSTKINSACHSIGESLKRNLKKDAPNEVKTALKSLNDTINSQKSRLSELKNKYQDLYLTQGKNSKEAKETAKEIKELSEELNKNERELQEAKQASDKFGNSLDDLKKDADETESRLASMARKVAGTMATVFAIDKIKDFGASLVDASASVSAENSAFAQIMGKYSEEAQTKLEEVGKKTGVVSTRLTGHMTSLTAKFKGLGFGVDEATDLASEGLLLASDASAFWDKSLEDSMSALNSFINGSYEGGEAIGLFANDTQMAQYAVKKGLVESAKEWANLDEKTKQATRLEYAKQMMEQSGATGQAAKEAGQYANVQANLAEAWRQFKAQIGDPLLQNVVIPAMNSLMGVVEKLNDKWNQLTQWISENKDRINEWVDILIIAGTVIGAYVLVAGTMSILKTVATWIKSVATAQKLLNLVMAVNPIALLVAGLAGLVIAFVKAYNSSETFRNKVNDVAKAVKDAWFITVEWFKGLPEWFKNLWDSIANWTINTWKNIENKVTSTVSNFIKAVKNKINNFKSSIINIVTNLVNGVKTKFNNFKASVSNIWNNIKSAILTSIKELPSKMVDVGKNIVEGLWNGINNAKDWVVGKAKGVWNAISDSAKNIFDTHSPSRLFAWIGQMLGFGLGEGIEDSQGVAIGAVEEMGEETISSFQKAMNGLESWFGSNPALKRIGQAFGFNLKEETIPEVEESAEEIGKTLTDVVTNTVDNGSDKPKKAFDQILREIANSASNYANKALNHITSLGNAIKDFQNQQIENDIKTKEQELRALHDTTEEKLNEAKLEHDKEVALAQDKYDKGILSERQLKAQKEALARELNENTKKIKDDEQAHEEKLKKEREELERKQFESKKKNDIALVWINFASATMRAFAENFWGTALVITGALATQAGLQSAAIASQKYTPAFAQGGIVNNPTTALIGEDGREAVVPLERNTEWVGGLARAISPAIVSTTEAKSDEIKSLREELVTIRSMLSDYLSKLLMKDTDIVINGESLAYAIAPSIDINLGDIDRLRRRGV